MLTAPLTLLSSNVFWLIFSCDLWATHAGPDLSQGFPRHRLARRRLLSEDGHISQQHFHVQSGDTLSNGDPISACSSSVVERRLVAAPLRRPLGSPCNGTRAPVTNDLVLAGGLEIPDSPLFLDRRPDFRRERGSSKSRLRTALAEALLRAIGCPCWHSACQQQLIRFCFLDAQIAKSQSQRFHIEPKSRFEIAERSAKSQPKSPPNLLKSSVEIATGKNKTKTKKNSNFKSLQFNIASGLDLISLAIWASTVFC